MSAAFTPGPWTTASRFAFGKGEVAVECGGNEGIIPALCGGPDAEANARLIAAAPDLYEALALFERQWNACGPNSDFGRYFQNVRHAATTALAKARGEA